MQINSVMSALSGVLTASNSDFHMCTARPGLQGRLFHRVNSDRRLAYRQRRDAVTDRGARQSSSNLHALVCTLLK